MYASIHKRDNPSGAAGDNDAARGIVMKWGDYDECQAAGSMSRAKGFGDTVILG